ncbi:type II toxin-antitoxin system HicB family antitoxin [Lacticaseibacillus zhaodongensis]|uniref:type II toxin-antitoxin system HicB family antitoxin n=1 Tax=Lacticaseibacillus zhaodongensis TaxID=2668065 RepID=UPI0012D33659|nr:type II toxin-antitoxin system HicB family antitoxin [Lacticaseibacillus zhaodongensis]
MPTKDLEYYLSRHYPTLIDWIDEDQMYSVSVPLLSGLVVYDEQLTNALAELIDAKREWLSTAIGRGINIPEPQETPVQGFVG